MADNVNMILNGIKKQIIPVCNRILVKPRILIIRKQLPYWQERGWRENGGDYDGFYKTRYGMWKGKIETVHSQEWRFQLYDPPLEQLKSHPHWICFHENGDGSYWLHFSRQPKDVSSGILHMEGIINESFRR